MEIEGKLVFVMRGRNLFDWTVVMNIANYPPPPLSKFSVVLLHPRLYYGAILVLISMCFFSEYELSF
jgi:hypothetical protein